MSATDSDAPDLPPDMTYAPELGEPPATKAASTGLKHSKLHEEYMRRMAAGRDMKIVVTGEAETGVGKTTLAFALAAAWDLHGFDPQKATLQPREFESMYNEHPPGSVLILDEAEQALDSRDSMTNENQAVGQKFAQCRYQQIVSIMTLPSITWLDKRIREDVVDYWVECLEANGRPKGEARVYRVRKDDHRGKTLTYKTETINWNPLDHISEFRALERKKDRHTTAQTESGYISQDDHEKALRKERKKFSKEVRDAFVAELYAQNELSQTEVAELTEAVAEHSSAVDSLSQQSVSRIKNEVLSE